MALKVVGAGLGRTGTHSLKLGLEKLLGAPCYHMAEVFERPQDVPVWHQAALGNMPDWDKFLAGYAAEVDWPSSAFWDELSQAYPESLILLSVRDPESWWESASQTIFGGISGAAERNPEWFEMIKALFTSRFTADLQNKQACIDAFNRHNDHVIKTAPKDRLLVWQAKEGYEPICRRLGLPAPEEPFPRSNSKEEFLARLASRD